MIGQIVIIINIYLPNIHGSSLCQEMGFCNLMSLVRSEKAKQSQLDEKKKEILKLNVKRNINVVNYQQLYVVHTSLLCVREKEQILHYQILHELHLQINRRYHMIGNENSHQLIYVNEFRWYIVLVYCVVALSDTAVGMYSIKM
eukprot:341728_1